MLPTQRSGSGRWAAVAEAAEDYTEDYAEEYAPEAAPAAAGDRGRSPAALVSIGGAAAAVAVIATLFLWPAPRTTNSAVSRPAPLVPALTAPALPTVELTPTPTLTPTTHRPRPAPTRARRAAAPVPPPVPVPVPVETTPAPERVGRSERDGDHLGTAVGVDDAPDDPYDDEEEGRRLRSRGLRKGPFRIPERALSVVAPTGFEPALPP